MPGLPVAYAYDAIGNRLAMTDTLGVTRYTYDALGRMKTMIDPEGRRVSYGYDAVGNLTSLSYPGYETMSYTYDAANRLIKGSYNRLWDTQDIFWYQYDAANRPTDILLANDFYTHYIYDDADRLTKIVYGLLGTAIFDYYSYTLDAVGNRLSMTDGGETFYQYDALNRLTRVANSDGLASSYTYDPVGNRTSMTPGNGNPVNYTYDAANRLVLSQIEGLTNAGGLAYTWDDNGNLLSDGVRTFTYDAANRLSAVSDGMNLSAFVYNGDGARVSQTANGLTTDYILDVNAALPVVLAEQQQENTKNYFYGLGLAAHQSKRVIYGGGDDDDRIVIDWRYYHTDGLGSTRLLTDERGWTAASYTYDAFGALRGENEPVTPFLFTGEQYDAGTGLYYLRARYYDPGVGRFLSRDPFPGLMGNPQTHNPYPYVVNNPVNLTDPSGEIAILPILAGAALYAGGYALYSYADSRVQGGWQRDALNVAGFLTGYESIQQDWKTLNDACSPGLCKALAAGDMALNIALGVSTATGLVGGTARAIRAGWAMRGMTAGGKWRYLHSLAKTDLMSIRPGAESYRLLGKRFAWIKGETANGWRLAGRYMHEWAHAEQEFNGLGGISRFFLNWSAKVAPVGEKKASAILSRLKKLRSPDDLAKHSFSRMVSIKTNFAFDWLPVLSAEDKPYFFSCAITDFMKQSYKHPAVYRWNIYKVVISDERFTLAKVANCAPQELTGT